MIIWLQLLGGLATAAGLLTVFVGALLATSPTADGTWLLPASGVGILVTGGILLAHARTIQLLEAIAATPSSPAHGGEPSEPTAAQRPARPAELSS